MNAPVQTAEAREIALAGMGASRLRKEDARFIQGKGNYVDDIKMPGMLHMDIVRAPVAHARIKKIHKEAALAMPGVHAVLTADDLKPLKLHWMPTLAGDVAAVLADEKVHFQMQEVAIVIADDRYIAADAVEAVEVEYEELPVVIDPYDALKPDAPVLREDLAGKTSGAHGPREHHNHIFTWEAGDKAAADAAAADAAAPERFRLTGRQMEVLSLIGRGHPNKIIAALNNTLQQPEKLWTLLQLQGTYTATADGVKSAVVTMSDASSPLLSTKACFDHKTYPWVIKSTNVAERCGKNSLVLLNNFVDNALTSHCCAITKQRGGVV